MKKKESIFLYILLTSHFLTTQAWAACNSFINDNMPDKRYTVDTANEVVTDTQTGLMWKLCQEGLSGATCATGSAITANWSTALTTGTNSSHATYTNWRLPTIKELMSIVDNACSAPSTNTTVFPATSSTAFWSGSPAVTTNTSWQISFSTGKTIVGNRANSKNIRLVRTIP